MAGVTVVCTVAMVFLSLLPAYRSETLAKLQRYYTPSVKYPFGTDRYGQGILSKLIVSSKAYITPGLLAIGIAVIGGVILGSISGYYSQIYHANGKKGKARLFSLSFLDIPILYVFNLTDSLPQLALIFLVCVTIGTNFLLIASVLGFMGAMKLGGLIRSEIISLRRAEYIEAAIELGLSDVAILWRHLLLTRLRPLIISRAFHIFAEVVLVETTLRFFFVTIGAENSWGKLLVDAKSYIFTQQNIRELGMNVHLWWLWFFPALLITANIVALYLLADAFAAKGEN